MSLADSFADFENATIFDIKGFLGTYPRVIIILKIKWHIHKQLSIFMNHIISSLITITIFFSLFKYGNGF